ncbi:MAG: GNAT family N-acetyltransferase [Oscillospiraceae bacterium]
MLFLRVCDESDIPNAAQMLCQVYAEAPWNENWTLDRAEKRITSYLSGIHSRGYALITETQVIGYLFGRTSLAVDKDFFYVDEIFVHPNYQRKGCGSMALDRLQDELKKDGINEIELHALAEDAAFYAKNGFTPSAYVNMEKKY